jgi:hypothetical protein
MNFSIAAGRCALQDSAAMRMKKAVPAKPEEDLPALLQMLTGGSSIREIGKWIDRVADADPLRAQRLVIEMKAYYCSTRNGTRH